MMNLSLFSDQVFDAPSTEGIKYAGSKLKLLPHILQMVGKTSAKTEAEEPHREFLFLIKKGRMPSKRQRKDHHPPTCLNDFLSSDPASPLAPSGDGACT
ncbi:MAG: hypothetical protein NTW21_38330 [Verrucomicrobia bacterium]|nr:hypothetical protein [Verrucomicrobiota bacterium]